MHRQESEPRTSLERDCSLLRSEGIKCADRMADSIESNAGWREILVSEPDLASARELLAGADKYDVAKGDNRARWRPT